jgi:hypothetical protein
VFGVEGSTPTTPIDRTLPNGAVVWRAQPLHGAVGEARNISQVQIPTFGGHLRTLLQGLSAFGVLPLSAKGKVFGWMSQDTHTKRIYVQANSWICLLIATCECVFSVKASKGYECVMNIRSDL